MQNAQRPRHRIPFPDDEIRRELDRLLNKRVEDQLRVMRCQYLSASNIWRIKHGRRWYSLHSDNPAEASEARMHSSETAISKERIVDHDLVLLTELSTQMVDTLHGQFMSTMLQTMDEVTKASGNIVADTDIKQSLEVMLKGIKFGVDQYGVPSTPTALVTPAVMRKIEVLAAEEDHQHSQRIADITDAKKREALAEEARRISRYHIA